MLGSFERSFHYPTTQVALIDKSSKQEATLTARAVRNLPWSSELWCRRLRSLERSYEEGSAEGSSESADGGAKAAAATSAVRAAWREALARALPSPDDYVKVT